MPVWEILGSYPVNLYTIVVGVLVFFWVLVIIGAADMDIISIEADPHLHMSVDIDMNAESSVPGFVGLMKSLGLLGIPFSVVLSVHFFTAWVLTYIMSSIMFMVFSPGIMTYLIGSGILVGNFFLAIPVTVIAVKPFRKVFERHSAMSNKDIVGSICRVTSLEVDRKFGQGVAIATDGEMNVRIRSDVPNSITKGSLVRIIAYNDEDNSYEVISEEEFKSKTL